MARSIRDINSTPPPNNPGVLCKIVQKYDIKRKVFAIGLKRPKTKIPRKSAGLWWWGHRDSLARRWARRLWGTRDDLTALHWSNLLGVEPWGMVLVRFAQTKK